MTPPRSIGLMRPALLLGLLLAGIANSLAQAPSAAELEARALADQNYAKAVVLQGTCRFSVKNAFSPCGAKVGYFKAPSGIATFTFTSAQGDEVFVLSGKTDRQPNLENFYVAINLLTSMRGGTADFDHGMEGECHVSHSRPEVVLVVYSVRCDVYNRHAGSGVLRFYLENVTAYDDIKTDPTGARKPVAGSDRRVALVIGNAGYVQGKLNNPRNDAALMAKALEAVGFEVTELIDAEQSAMKRAMLDFSRKARSNAAATLFYYAGHGVEIDGENYLIPVDAEIGDMSEVAVQAVNVTDFLGALKGAASKINIVILDACRNNPFGAAGRGIGGGLAMLDAPGGTYIAFSTAPRQVALDGDGENSPYTKALAAAIGVPGLRIEDVFKEVRRVVIAETRQKQVPWDTTSITGDFYFVPAK